MKRGEGPPSGPGPAPGRHCMWGRVRAPGGWGMRRHLPLEKVAWIWGSSITIRVLGTGGVWGHPLDSYCLSPLFLRPFLCHFLGQVWVPGTRGVVPGWGAPTALRGSCSSGSGRK